MALITKSTIHERAAGPYQLFMLILCVFVLLALAADVFLQLDGSSSEVLRYVDTGICMIFLIDFVVNFLRADKKLRFLKWGWIDLVSSIPMIGPLRVGRAARIFRIVRLLRGVRSSKWLIAYILKRRAQSTFLAAALITIVIITFSSIYILQYETAADSNIKTPADAVWWSFVTVTSVGYGDRVPVTGEGRIIASVLMTVGMCFFCMFTGFVASWFMEAKSTAQEEEISSLKALVKTLTQRLEDKDASSKAAL